MPPVNDAFADAIDLGATASGSTTGTNVDATIETDEPDTDSYGDVSVWWKWTCPAGKITATFRLLGSTNTTSDPGAVLDTVLYAYDPSAGPLITDLVLIDYNDDGPVDYTSELTFSVTPGQLYYLKVDGYSSDMQGDLVIAWETEDAPPPPPPPPADCGVFVLATATEFGIYNPGGPTVTNDDTVFFLNGDSSHLCSVPINPVGSLTDWGSWTGSFPVATNSQLAWISNPGSLATSNTIEISVAPFSDPTDDSVAFTYTESGVNTLFGYTLAVDADGEHIIATIMKGFGGPGPDITTEVWRIDLSDGSHEVLYTSSYNATTGSPDDSDLAVIGVNNGLEVTPDGYIWAGTATGKYFRLAPDGSTSDAWGGGGSGDAVRIGIARLCQPDVIIANDAAYLVTIDGLSQRHWVDTKSDHATTVRTCAPYMNASAGVPLWPAFGRRPDYKRAVWFQIRRDDSARELWTFTCPRHGGWGRRRFGGAGF